MIFRLANRSVSIREDDLHAYADGLLDGARQRRVEQHISAHPEDADRIAGFQRLNAGLADLGTATRDEELGPALVALREDLCGALVRQRQLKRTVSAATASILLLAAASGAWMLSGWEPEGVERPFQTAATGSPHPGASAEESFEIRDGTEDEIEDWLSQKVELDRFSAPDLNSAGFTLAGARVVPMADGPLIQVLYRNGGEAPLTFTISGRGVPHDSVRVGDLSDRQLAVYWRRGPLTYSLVGPMRHADLAMLADLVGGYSLEKSAKAEATTASAQAASEKPGVVLIDSSSEATTASASPAKSAASVPDESVKTPPEATAEKIEEPKPL